jgi:hypothetical protein
MTSALPASRSASRIGRLGVCVAASLAVLLPIAAHLTAIADPRFNHPCINYQLGETLMWPLPVTAIVLAWLGLVSSVVAAAGSAVWLRVRPHDDAGVARRPQIGWAPLLACGVVCLLVNAVMLYSMYSGGLSRIADCAF